MVTSQVSVLVWVLAWYRYLLGTDTDTDTWYQVYYVEIYLVSVLLWMFEQYWYRYRYESTAWYRYGIGMNLCLAAVFRIQLTKPNEKKSQDLILPFNN